MRRLVLSLSLVFAFAPALRAATFLVPDDATLVRTSRAVVVGTALESYGRHDAGRPLVTVTELRVDEVISGPIEAGETIDVADLGGFAGGIGLAIPGSPRYTTGERYLVFLDADSRGEWVTRSMDLGQFHFTSDTLGRALLLRDAPEIAGWGVDGTPHREPIRSAPAFLRYVRRVAAGDDAPVDYVVPAAPSPRTRTDAAPTITSYLIQSTGSAGTLGIRWNSFPAASVFLSHGSQPGALNGGLTSVQRAFSAWDNSGAVVVYQYGGTTTVSQGFKNADGVNSIQFNDPSDEIPGAFTGNGGDVLAIGGAWFGSATHTFSGETFYTISEADLIIQDGIFGAGLTGDGFDHVVAHELGHTLGLRHSDQPPAGGTSTSFALMNSSVNFNNDPTGAALQAWDLAAITAAYGTTSTGGGSGGGSGGGTGGGTIGGPGGGGGTTCTPPSITSQPPASTTLGGAAVVLSVTAAGTEPLSYQWYIGQSGNTAQALAGATTGSISIKPSVTTSYWVRVTGQCGTPADSTTSTIVVNGCPAVSIAQLSPDVTVFNGVATDLSVQASGGTLSYQWFMGPAGNTAAPIQGATGPTLHVTPATTTQYWVLVKNGCGASVESQAVTVSVVICNAPKILVQPAGGAVTQGTSTALYAGVTGSDPLTYQWYRGTPGDTSSPITGATRASITTSPISTASSFWLRASNGCGTVDSAAANVTIASACVAPVITRQPQPVVVPLGAPAVVSVEATGTNLVYQWYLGPAFDLTHPIGGSGPAVVTPAITSPTEVWVRITGRCGSAVNSTTAVVKPTARRRAAGQ